MAEVESLAPVKLVEITGGEPMLQAAGAGSIYAAFARWGIYGAAGNQWEPSLGNVPPQVHKIVDVKCPGSGEGGSFRMEIFARPCGG